MTSTNGRSGRSGDHRPESAGGRGYRDATGEALSETLDIDTWDPAYRLAERFERLQTEIAEAHVRETENRRDIRAHAFPLIERAAGAPRNAGVHPVRLDHLREIQSKLLFGGHVQAADGASVVHQTLPVTVVQTGVALVNYLGEHGTWGHRIFQKDVKVSGQNGLDRILDLLQRRSERGDADESGISDMLRRGLMAHAELAVLTRKSTSQWRMGHGHPLPKELLTGANLPELIELSLPLFQELLLDHRNFVYVPKGTNQLLLQTIGDALLPLEFAIVETLDGYMARTIDAGHYGQQRFREAHIRLDEFQERARGNLVAGVFRVSPFSPSRVFYAHADVAPQAALVAMADALLVEARGFPMLLDIAGTVCREMFPPDALLGSAAAAATKIRAAEKRIAR